MERHFHVYFLFFSFSFFLPVLLVWPSLFFETHDGLLRFLISFSPFLSSLYARVNFARCLCLQSQCFTNSCSAFCLSVTLALPQLLLLLSSSSSPSSSLSLFISSYAFANCSFGRNLNSDDAEKRYFYIQSIRYQVKGPIENFQTRSLHF